MYVKKVTHTRIESLFIIFLILSYFVNAKVFSFIRLTDIVIVSCFTFFLLAGWLKTKYFDVSIILFLFCMILSTLLGALFFIFDLRGVVFFYKYIIIFCLYWVLVSSEDTIKRYGERYLKILFLTFVALSIYVILRPVLSILGLVQLRGGIRPDFPFTNNEKDVSNAGHLFGVFLGIGMVSIYYHLKVCFGNKRQRILKILVIMIGLISTILTGSRTPIIAFIFVFAFDIIYEGMMIFIKGKKSIRIQDLLKIFIGILLLTVVILTFLPYLMKYIEQTDLFNTIARRTFNFSFSSDASTFARFRKILIGFDMLSKTGWLLGPGPTAYSGWFDNGIIRVANDAGVMGFFFFLILVWNLYVSNRISGAKQRVLRNVFIYFCISNISTEFFLVTRMIVPFLLFYLIYAKSNDGISICNKGVIRDESIDHNCSSE